MCLTYLTVTCYSEHITLWLRLESNAIFLQKNNYLHCVSRTSPSTKCYIKYCKGSAQKILTYCGKIPLFSTGHSFFKLVKTWSATSFDEIGLARIGCLIHVCLFITMTNEQARKPTFYINRWLLGYIIIALYLWFFKKQSPGKSSVRKIIYGRYLTYMFSSKISHCLRTKVYVCYQ